jgi:hypothetical protein
MTKDAASKLPPELWQPIVEHASNYARTRGTPASPAHYAKLREALRWASQWAAVDEAETDVQPSMRDAA